jgi:hypothetical protein
MTIQNRQYLNNISGLINETDSTFVGRSTNTGPVSKRPTLNPTGPVPKLTPQEMLQNYLNSVASGEVEFNVNDLLAILGMFQ